ncbi:MAG: WD40 domain-containing protein [Candidatus Hodarchaeales archaeon]
MTEISKINYRLRFKITLWILIFIISFFVISPKNSYNIDTDENLQDRKEEFKLLTENEYYSTFTKWGGNCEVQINRKCSGLFFDPISISVNTSGIIFVTDSGNDRIQLFDKYGNLLAIWNNLGLDQPSGIAINSSGYVFVGDSGNHQIVVLSPEGKIVDKWGHDSLGSSLPDLVILKNEKLAISDLDNKRILIFDKYGNVENTTITSTALRSLAVHPITGNLFATDLDTDSIREFDENGNNVFTFGISGLNVGELFDPTGISFDSAYNLIIANSNNDRIQIFDISGNHLLSLNGLESGSEIFNYIQDIVYYDDNLYVVESGNHQWVKVLNKVVYTEPDIVIPILNPSTISFGLDHTAMVFSTGFSPNGKDLISGDADGNIKIRSLVNNFISHEMTTNKSSIYTLKYSPDGEFVFSGGADTSINMWKLSDSTIVTTLVGHNGAVKSIDISPDGLQLLSGGTDGQALLWDIQNETVVKKFTNHTSVVSTVAFSHSGNLLATGSWDRSVKLWETSNFDLVRTISLDTNSSEISSLSFSPDDQKLIFGDFNGKIGIVDVENTTDPIQIINAHSDKVLTIDYHPDNLHFASGGKDGRIFIHDVKNSSNTYQQIQHASSVSTVVFSPDYTSLASGTYDHKVYLLNLNLNRSQDSDNDGMIDIFEKINGLNPYHHNDKYLDADLDGLTNIMEFLHWSNPNDSDTDLDGLPDEIEFKNNLKISFNDAQLDCDSDGLPNLWEFENNFEICLNDALLDLDNDNLSNLQEYNFGSDPLKADPDGDGMNDGEELNAGTNPLIDNRLLDSDSDGMTDVWEYQHGLNLNVDDSNEDFDNDGIINILEYTYDLNPNKAVDALLDSDGDGFNNLEEILAGFDPLNSSSYFNETTTAGKSPIFEASSRNAVIGGILLAGGIMSVFYVGTIIIKRRRGF